MAALPVQGGQASISSGASLSACERRKFELVTYRREGHSLYSPANLRDYTGRILRWLDRRLSP